MEPNQNQQPQPDVQAVPVSPIPANETPKEDTSATVPDNKKLYGILGYIIPILFFLPLIDEKLKTDTEARFHANQQLILLILAVGVHFVIGNILYMILGPLASMLASIINIAILVLVILGVMNVLNGKQKELPVIGQFKIIK